MSTVSQDPPAQVLPRWVFLVFFISGFAALIYQVAWQRALFTIVGINIESVTIVVTAFMLGLGAGSLAGGVVSRDPKRPALVLFAAAELGIAVFGFFSLRLFHAMDRWVLTASPASTALAVFLLVLVPTTLMGATLPLLTAHAVRASGNVGRSVGALYFINTAGSAVASIAAALFFLGRLGLQGSVELAAVLNAFAGAWALFRGRRP